MNRTLFTGSTSSLRFDSPERSTGNRTKGGWAPASGNLGYHESGCRQSQISTGFNFDLTPSTLPSRDGDAIEVQVDRPVHPGIMLGVFPWHRIVARHGLRPS
jgi:hypothetical protein